MVHKEEITVYELTQYLNLAGDTTEVVCFQTIMESILEWSNQPYFGAVRIFTREDGIEDAVVDARQCVLISSTYSMPLQVYVVNRLCELEYLHLGTRTYLDKWDVGTIYGLVRYLEVEHNIKVDHDKVDNDLLRYVSIPGFGKCEGWVLAEEFGNLGTVRRIATNKVSPRQALMLAGQYGMKIQSRVIDDLHVLEVEYTPDEVLQDMLPEAIIALREWVVNQTNPFESNEVFEIFTDTEMRFYFKVGFYIDTVFNLENMDGVTVHRDEEHGL